MLYATEIIELMAAFPGRDFKMAHVVNYVIDGKEINLREKRAVRKAVIRAITALSSTGCVLIRPPRASRGGYANYRWRG